MYIESLILSLKSQLKALDEANSHALGIYMVDDIKPREKERIYKKRRAKAEELEAKLRHDLLFNKYELIDYMYKKLKEVR